MVQVPSLVPLVRKGGDFTKMDLITLGWEEKMRQEGPLAQRMRPRNLEEFAGQSSILALDKPLRRLIDSDRLVSMIFFGPAGTGKTTLARIIASTTRAAFVQLNAVSAGVKELRQLIDAAKERWSIGSRRTVLFIDEIHRFNKSQQDALLAAVEQGTVIFIGATTENPFFSLNNPLLSRTKLFIFEPLKAGEILAILQRALSDRERGLGDLPVEADSEALTWLAGRVDGDARAALSTLELAVAAAQTQEEKIPVTLNKVKEAMRNRPLAYDRLGDNHYDAASAMIKSIRGSDPDAALYWMARMLKGGEDPLFIARRLIISASEDIGNADPRALQLAVAAAQAVQMIGLPEGRIPLAQVACYLASVPKSNASYLAINAAMQAVDKEGSLAVPSHLKDSSYRGASQLNHGKGYRYPHDYPGHYTLQQYLPVGLRGMRFYKPTEQGLEKQIKERLERLRSAAAYKEERGDGE